METADWQIEILHRKEDMTQIEEWFGGEALALASFELDEKANLWRSSVFLAHKPDNSRLAMLLEGFTFSVLAVQHKDWVVETQANFPPRRIGRFLVLGSHHHGISEAGSIPLYLDAGAAFGTGEHATTEGCLRALELIVKRSMEQKARTKKPEILDMGCGSGILGIAAAKSIIGARVLGVEIDPVATAVAMENVRRNQVAARCRMVTGNGYACPQLEPAYDLVFANILAAPLVKFAPMLKRHLVVDGYAILSGLLTTQADWVLSVHRVQGMALVKRIVIGDWTTLVLRR